MGLLGDLINQQLTGAPPQQPMIPSGGLGQSSLTSGFQKINDNSGGSSPMPSRQSTVILEEWRDPMKGKMFKGKTAMNWGKVKTVIQTIEEGGKQSVIFNDSERCAIEQLPVLYDFIDPLPSNPNSANGLSYDDEPDAMNIIPGRYNGSQPTNQPGTVITSINNEPRRRNPPPKKSDPVTEFLKKMKMKEIDCDLKMKLKLPSKLLFIDLMDSFDDVEDKLIDFIFSEEQIRHFKLAVRESLRLYYELDPLTSEEKENLLLDNTLDKPVNELLNEFVEKEVSDIPMDPPPLPSAKWDIGLDQLDEMEKNLTQLATVDPAIEQAAQLLKQQQAQMTFQPAL